MTNQQTIEELLAEEASIDHVIATLESLRTELRENPDNWENTSLQTYLEAMQAWLTDFRDRVGEEPSWRLISLMLDAAKLYE